MEIWLRINFFVVFNLLPVKDVFVVVVVLLSASFIYPSHRKSTITKIQKKKKKQKSITKLRNIGVNDKRAFISVVYR